MFVSSAEFHGHEEVAPDGGADGFQNVQRQPGARAQVAVVLVVAVVDRARQELVQDVAIARHDLDAVGARFAGPPRGSCVGLHQLMNLRDGHPARAQPIEEVRPVGCARSRDVDELLAGNVALPAGEVELDDVTAVVPVHLVHQPTP